MLTAQSTIIWLTCPLCLCIIHQLFLCQSEVVNNIQLNIGVQSTPLQNKRGKTNEFDVFYVGNIPAGFNNVGLYTDQIGTKLQ